MEFDHPAGVTFMAQNQPFLWNGERLPIRRAPFFGEHNEAVYRQEMRLDDEELTQLMVERGHPLAPRVQAPTGRGAPTGSDLTAALETALRQGTSETR